MSRDDEKTRLYNAMMQRNRRIIYKVCYMYATDEDHLKDLCQDVAASIWQGIDRFNGDSAESTWVYRVSLNTCITNFRRNDRHRHNVGLDSALAVADDSGESAERNLMLRQMYELISSLNKIDRAIVMLWLDQYSYEEISTLTGISRNNVASRLLRARRQLVKLSNQ